jgi:uracil-DNA glycosylase family 4
MSQSPSPHDEFSQLTRHLRAYLEALQIWGVQYTPVDRSLEPRAPEFSSPEPSSPSHPHTSSPTQSPRGAGSMLSHPISSQELQAIRVPPEPPAPPLASLALAELEAVAKPCTLCRLHQGRTHVVFGVGNPQAALMFVGEAPGRDEDLQGEPFVGRAGQLLTRIIEAIGMKRQDVYIANVIKCRPPNNRNPEADEIARCEPYLIRQIELVQPRLIVALGTFAAQSLLKTKLPISQLRGRFHTYQGVRVMPTFHPAFLLRNPERKRAVWEDMQVVQRELRQPLP